MADAELEAANADGDVEPMDPEDIIDATRNDEVRDILAAANKVIKVAHPTNPAINYLDQVLFCQNVPEEDGGYLAAVTMGQADSVFISNLVIYDLTQEDPVADYSVPDGLVTAMTGRGDRILTVTDTCLAVGNTAGKLVGTYSYNGEYLREYDLGGEDYTVLQLNRYQSGSVGRLVTVDDDGEEIASLDVAEEVRDVSACGRYLSVLYADRLVVYNRQLQVYATLHGPEHTHEVLTRADGSVLMIGADSAELFLP